MGSLLQPAPQWEFRNEGKEILQKTNSAPGIAIGSTQVANHYHLTQVTHPQMAGMDFEGTFYVGPHELLDNDFIGFIFSFQVPKLASFLPFPGQQQFLLGDVSSG